MNVSIVVQQKGKVWQASVLTPRDESPSIFTDQSMEKLMGWILRSFWSELLPNGRSFDLHILPPERG